MELTKEKILAMAIAAVAEECGEEISCLRVVSFREVHESSLQQYIADNKIKYRKYKLGG